jgi:hypothetical protein
MAEKHEPVVLELAPLPREQIGPFLILGLDKDAGKDQIEANWARRVIWARKNQTRLPLEDVNWARETVSDPDKRVRADVCSLNADTTDGTLARLAQRYGVGGAAPEAGWQPLDREKDLAGYVPPVEVPDPETVRRAIALPEVPAEVPAAGRLLEQFAGAPLSPWDPDLLHPGGPTPPLATQGPAHE